MIAAPAMIISGAISEYSISAAGIGGFSAEMSCVSISDRLPGLRIRRPR